MIGIDSYRKNAVTLASPAQLVMMLYETALRRLAKVEAALDGGPPTDVIADLHRVREIVIELSSALDPTSAPELCKKLGPLYEWMLSECVAAGRDKDVAKVRAVQDALLPIAEGWRAILEDDLRRAVGQ